MAAPVPRQTDKQMPPEQAKRRATRRVEFARQAAQAIALEANVEPTAGGGRWVTGDGEGEIPGVLAGEDAEGRINLELHLVAHWPSGSLERVAAALRERLAQAAQRQGLSAALGAIDVTIHDLALDERGKRSR